VPEAQRICLTHQQVEAEVDRRVRRPLQTVNNVRRFLNSNDAQIRQVGVPDSCHDGRACKFVGHAASVVSCVAHVVHH
jgi:hypothetical protein